MFVESNLFAICCKLIYLQNLFCVKKDWIIAWWSLPRGLSFRGCQHPPELSPPLYPVVQLRDLVWYNQERNQWVRECGQHFIEENFLCSQQDSPGDRNIPIRFILVSRRLDHLHYILNEDEDSLLRRFFMAQQVSPVRGDWVMKVTSSELILRPLETFYNVNLI